MLVWTSTNGGIRKELSLVRASMKRLDVRAASPEMDVRNLSGGNQQKVVVGKWLLTDPRIIFFDEPTRGIDVGAKAEMYKLLNELTRRGVGVLMVSSDLPEILAMSDRILVMCAGRVTAIIDRADATEERIMAAATGGDPKPGAGGAARNSEAAGASSRQ